MGECSYVVDVLAANGGSDALALGLVLDDTLITELRLLLHKVLLDGVVVTVVKLTVLDGTQLGSVRLGEHLAVLHGLDGAVVVVLVDLLVDRGDDLLVHVRLHGLVDNGRGDSLMDSGVMVAGAGSEVGEGCLDFVHCEVCGCCGRRLRVGDWVG
jgi:hypothetical protein